jgi:hypothetical protein
MTALSVDIFTIIAKYCDFKTLQRLRSTCRRLHTHLYRTWLPAKYECNLTNDACEYFPYLTKLSTDKNHRLTRVDKLLKLTELRAGHYSLIVDISPLTNLTVLHLSFGGKITDRVLSLMTNLTALHVDYNTNITDSSIQHLTKLTILNATGTLRITDLSIRGLINLTELYAGYNPGITDNSICMLPRLTLLDASNNQKITDKSIIGLTNLVELHTDFNPQITDKSIYMLPRLLHLHAYCNPNISARCKEMIEERYILFDSQ